MVADEPAEERGFGWGTEVSGSQADWVLNVQLNVCCKLTRVIWMQLSEEKKNLLSNLTGPLIVLMKVKRL